MERFGVVAWNMGRRRHVEAWRYLIDVLDPDVALLQETVPPASVLEQGRVVHAQAYPDKHRWGSAVYAKRTPISEIDLGLRAGFFAAAELTLPDGEAGACVSVHARLINGHVRPYLDEALAEIEQLVGGRRCLIGGDFNLSRNYDRVYGTAHHTAYLAELEARYANCCRRFKFEEQQSYFGSGVKNAYQDDHLFASSSLADSLRDCRVLGQEAIGCLSDHTPVVADFAFARRRAAVPA